MKMNGYGEREGNRKQQNASLGGGACKALDRVTVCQRSVVGVA